METNTPSSLVRRKIPEKKTFKSSWTMLRSTHWEAISSGAYGESSLGDVNKIEFDSPSTQDKDSESTGFENPISCLLPLLRCRQYLLDSNTKSNVIQACYQI
ncbi:unnamed protein product [Cochlearia groenlandica]